MFVGGAGVQLYVVGLEVLPEVAVEDLGVEIAVEDAIGYAVGVVWGGAVEAAELSVS